MLQLADSFRDFCRLFVDYLDPNFMDFFVVISIEVSSVNVRIIRSSLLL